MNAAGFLSICCAERSDKDHALRPYMNHVGIKAEEIDWFSENPLRS